MDQGKKRSQVIIGHDENSKKPILGDDFYYFSKQKSYNIAIPKVRSQIYNHPYLMVEPRLQIDVMPFTDQQLA
jgi:hypothetical protein